MAKQATSPLVLAAEALEAAMIRLEETSENLADISFNSQKNLDRGAKLLQDISDNNVALDTELRKLVDALADIRRRQEATAEVVRTRGEALAARSEAYRSLLEGYAALGQRAAELNVIMNKIVNERGANTDLLKELETGMAAVGNDAQTLSGSAKDEDFGDLARQAESLKQQLHSAGLKLKQLKEKLS